MTLIDCALPPATQVDASLASRSPTRVSTMLAVTSHHVHVTLLLSCDTLTAPSPIPTHAHFDPATWVCYTDGSYSPAAPAGGLVRGPRT